MILETTAEYLSQLRSLLIDLGDQRICKPVSALEGATLGMHFRHVIEFYSCLFAALGTGRVHYDGRRRNPQLERHTGDCIREIDRLLEQLKGPWDNPDLVLQADLSEDGSGKMELQTNLNRELFYNIEHAVHHLALIRIGIQEIAPELILDPDLGVAASTKRNRKICAQ